MKILFPTDQSFKPLFKETLGFTDADFPYLKLAADLRNATNTVIETIGQDTYNDILTLYEDDDKDAVVVLSQYAVASLAYKTFAPANDLQHGTNGRKMLTDTDSKTPFEHMIVSSNDELERRSFRAMDDLLLHLDKTSETWRASQQYKDSHRLFVRTLKDFSKFYTINSRYLLQKLQPGLEMAERNNIIPRIGQTLYLSLKEKVMGTNNATVLPQDEILIYLIQQATVYGALAWSIPRLQATIFPEGVFQQIRGDRSTIKARMPMQNNGIDQMIQFFEADAAAALLKIEKHVAPPVAEIEVIDPRDAINFNESDKFVST